ncbi:TetR/AcrR family transcriptional regulator C-terminal domain-containing protein [Micromonospora parathelypteridis]|uniref:DNA-binding transcriptional regulator YhcF (GntR family) n=1 Tax=Micromonospora parathelypteridis TaxID=1839617 RepID=A0A840VN52_9ACTN|nr:TetR/AcrR family transcriptional regulator C-terminal domain-containing protein [Micromonospora parathelypteridis]MBB5478095.1 DNA-binding transcriptional regulator YhcF (GntR family) [Micromonospora parathelypteridis]GGO13352.1 GntR family transcriptional regulator [Micromonospora parathelypteridis]
MTELDESTPPYLRIVGELRRRITAGELSPGDRVPSTRQIVREWGVAMATASRALTLLRQEELVRAVPGVGMVVTGPESTPAGRGARVDARQRPARGVTRDQVVRTATEIADAEGLPGLSMRRIATELDVPTMSLYRQVRGKEQLLLLMADAAFAAHRLPRTFPVGWRAQLELLCRLQWSIYRRHPWLAQVISVTRPLMAPHAVAHTEWALRALAGHGLDEHDLLHLVAVLANHVRGTAVNLQQGAEAEQDTGLTDDEWMVAHAEVLAGLLTAGEFPHLARLSRSEIDLNVDSLFEFGLERLLDGVAELLEQ